MLKEFIRTNKKGRGQSTVPFITIGEGYIHFSKIFAEKYIKEKQFVKLFYDANNGSVGMEFLDKEDANAYKICSYTDKAGYTLHRTGAGQFVEENKIKKQVYSTIHVSGHMVVVNK